MVVKPCYHNDAALGVVHSIVLLIYIYIYISRCASAIYTTQMTSFRVVDQSFNHVRPMTINWMLLAESIELTNTIYRCNFFPFQSFSVALRRTRSFIVAAGPSDIQIVDRDNDRYFPSRAILYRIIQQGHSTQSIVFFVILPMAWPSREILLLDSMLYSLVVFFGESSYLLYRLLLLVSATAIKFNESQVVGIISTKVLWLVPS